VSQHEHVLTHTQTLTLKGVRNWYNAKDLQFKRIQLEMALKEEEEEEKGTLENWQSFPNKKTSLTRKQKQKNKY